MGIPAYFRWISEKYSRIMVDCIEYVNIDPSGTEHPIDASDPNPNGEFDNLYLDMNGIIHPCTHPEDRPAPTTEEEMFVAIFDYIDRIFSIVRPRKVLYMAIDGVAPRAKINQQRSRRFRSAKEVEDKVRLAEELKTEWEKTGLKIGEDDTSHLPFDSNVITPGTPFMSRLAIALRQFVDKQITDTPGWKDLAVIFSDASVPGEGEHKIAEYIRRERVEMDYNPNLKHVMYGLDADLIMLALATHEVNFTILREEVFPKRGGQRQGTSRPQGQRNDRAPAQIDTVIASQAAEAGFSTRAELGGKKPFHFLHVNILREYLDYEFKTDIENEIMAANKSADIEYDLERVLDDFVFLCFFVGNDFLPHLPTLDIREGAIDFLMELYKVNVPRIGYLTSAQGEVDFVRVRQLLALVGAKEDEVFQQRARREIQYAERAERERLLKEEAKKTVHAEKTAKSSSDSRPSSKASSARKRPNQDRDKGYQNAVFNMHTIELGQKEAPSLDSRALKKKKGDTGETKNPDESDSMSLAGGSTPKTESAVAVKTQAEFKEALSQRMREKNELKVFDNIKLGEEGWKERYYGQKFGWGPEDNLGKMKLLRTYVEGLQWVMKYYYDGCPSWGWYYPYHYAPFASDLVECDINTEDMGFELGKPFAPFTQLQAVMPASSGKLVLPTCYSDLMTDPKSPIIDYYPENFALDLNGKRFAWQGVALLPFIQEERLNAALAPLQSLLSEEEIERNSFGECCILIHKDTPLGRLRSKKESEDGSVLKRIPVEASWGQLFGKASYPLVKYGGTKNYVYTLIFRLPKPKPHSSQLLPAATIPPPVLNDASRADSRHNGWKQAKFGSLGRAAREIIVDRNRRIGNGGSHGPRGRPRPGGVQRTGYIPDVPVINRPFVGGNAAVSGMFGGLGGQQGQQQPNWMRGSRGGRGGRGSRGAHRGTQQRPAPNYFSHQRQHSQPHAQQQGAQPMPHAQQQGAQPMPHGYDDVYREPSMYGGYYGTGAQQATQHGAQHVQPNWNGLPQVQTGWQPRVGGQGAWGGVGASGTYSAPNVDGHQNGSADIGVGMYSGSGRGGQGQGGLAGPTAGALRLPSRGGNNRGRSNGQGQGEEYNGWDTSGYR